MNTIHGLMDGEDWSPDTLDATAEVVTATGRPISDSADDGLQNFNIPEELETPPEPDGAQWTVTVMFRFEAGGDPNHLAALVMNGLQVFDRRVGTPAVTISEWRHERAADPGRSELEHPRHLQHCDPGFVANTHRPI